MVDKVTLAISLPINGTSYDRAAAVCEAISAATMRGDSFGAIALGQLYSDLRPQPATHFELKDCTIDGQITIDDVKRLGRPL